jgi:anti-sigma factor RsiW
MTPPPQPTEHLNPEALSAWVDGELPFAQRQEIGRHLAACHPCAARVLSASQVKAATARAGLRFNAPPDALARLTAQLTPPRAKPSARPAWFRLNAWLHSNAWLQPVAWASLAAALLLGVSLIGWQRGNRAGTLTAELLDQHLATLSSAATPEIISTDRHTVKPWFQGRLPFSFNLPDTTALPPDSTLKGADLAFLNGQPAALLLFTIHKHQVSIFLTQRSGDSTFPLLSESRAGFTIRSATAGDLRIVAVSDVNPADLERLLSIVANAQSSV